MWRLWCKALGAKEGRNDREANCVGSIRTVILLAYLVTNCFIVAGVIRHWNNNQTWENKETMQSGICSQV
jgi:hypothetical protein